MGELFHLVLVDPMSNALVFMSRLLFNNFGLAIIALTVVLKAVTWPLTMSQLKSTRAMTTLQPQIQEIQKKYNDPKRRSEETMKLYREAGVNPLGCLLPMLVQIPIWIALYQSIRFVLGETPESLLSLSQRLYPWSFLQDAVPLQKHFLWLNLAQPDIIIAVLVGASMFVTQRMTTPQRALDPQQQQTQNMMLWMMPLMFGWFSLSVPSGLALYWFVSNVEQLGLQYIYMGPSRVSWRRLFWMDESPAKAPKAPLRGGDDGAGAEVPAAEEKPAPASDERRRRRRRGRRRSKR
jgi:YidC/Oxa1 family membrane protein insertase